MNSETKWNVPGVVQTLNHVRGGRGAFQEANHASPHPTRVAPDITNPWAAEASWKQLLFQGLP